MGWLTKGKSTQVISDGKLVNPETATLSDKYIADINTLISQGIPVKQNIKRDVTSQMSSLTEEDLNTLNSLLFDATGLTRQSSTEGFEGQHGKYPPTYSKDKDVFGSILGSGIEDLLYSIGIREDSDFEGRRNLSFETAGVDKDDGKSFDFMGHFYPDENKAYLGTDEISPDVFLKILGNLHRKQLQLSSTAKDFDISKGYDKNRAVIDKYKDIITGAQGVNPEVNVLLDQMVQSGGPEKQSFLTELLNIIKRR